MNEPVCNPHPKAPHSFNRNASHSAGRYVCDCESWDPYDAGYQQGLQDGLQRAYEVTEPEQSEPACYQYQDREGNWKPFINDKHYEDTKLDGSWPIRALYAAPPRREPLSDEQIHDIYDRIANQEPYSTVVTRRSVVRAIEQAHGITGEKT